MTEIVNRECLNERVSDTYTIGGKRVRCTIDMQLIKDCRAMDLDSEFSILKNPASSPDYFIVSEQPNKQGSGFMIDLRKSVNKKVSVETNQIQEGFNALQRILKKHINSKFRDVVNSLVYWGSIKKGENTPTVNCLEKSHRLRYLGRRELIKNLTRKPEKSKKDLKRRRNDYEE